MGGNSTTCPHGSTSLRASRRGGERACAELLGGRHWWRVNPTVQAHRQPEGGLAAAAAPARRRHGSRCLAASSQAPGAVPLSAPLVQG